MIESIEDLRHWFAASGVADLVDSCMGPLPRSKAAFGRWSDDQPDHAIRTVSPHPGSYRLSLMLEPLEARIWVDRRPVWGGMIPAHRFRICPPSEQGQWSRLSSCDIVNIFIPIELVDQLALLRGDLPTPTPTLGAQTFVQDRMVVDLVHKMLDAQSMAGALAREACDGLMTTLVCYLLEHHSKPADQIQLSGLAGVRLRRVLKYIAESSAESLPNAELAEMCGMSEAHFSREFRRAVGLPPHQYMMKQRLERACAALLSDDARIVDIAGQCGFADASHFSRAFSNQYGMSPTTFRHQRRAHN
ncbi:AraC family transcriptional regulator [Massilia sp. CF038]|uniref:AraC family transcriptional regulator n=1 Tax=Massilia sp. CF038 TaxID=1881045 RepID=UPI000920A58B|nr:AraC family transcriptional regulator [Massilia sp. CF038]SHG73510.1 AraC family transcriptional regulator [Massilia sp. CF038]